MEDICTSRPQALMCRCCLLNGAFLSKADFRCLQNISLAGRRHSIAEKPCAASDMGITVELIKNSVR
jgi:hypothetical protein